MPADRVPASPENSERLQIRRPSAEVVELRLSGVWSLERPLPDFGPARDAVSESGIQSVQFDSQTLDRWDSALVAPLRNFFLRCRENDVHIDQGGLPDGVRRLLALADAVPEKKDARKSADAPPFLARLGDFFLNLWRETLATFQFVGQATLSMKRLVTGRARFRASDFLVLLQDCGPSALPIITLISVLVGLILAFVGAIQLEMFGAEIFVANLVGLGMAREMGAMMAAIIMAGRTGAAFAAQIGTMQVNEEVDALRTLGLSAVDFLVLPRLLAMGLLMPLLAIYADVMGILGGAIVGVGMLDISPAAYFQQTQESVPLHHFATGLIKSVFFGAIVALSGCMRGMRCGRSAMAVGGAATSAVVTAIVWIIVTDAAFTVLFNVVGL
ncbi:MAG: MlaE family ABC transporter permease [Desulfococcaceae bacterium]